MPATTKQDAKANIHQRMLACMDAIERIAKRGHNDFHNYDFASAEDIKAEVRKALIANGVMVHTSTTDATIEVVPARDGKTAIMAVAWGTIAFINVDQPDDMAVDEWRGLAVDSSDKALSKAITAGVKYGLLNSLLIPTGDDPDAASPDAPTTERVTRQPQGNYGDPGPMPPDQPPMTHSQGRQAFIVTDDMDKCPKHNRDWRDGKYGYFCSAKDEATEKGYCILKPTELWVAEHSRDV